MSAMTIAMTALLIGLNALFVAAEFAVFGAPPLTIMERAKSGSRRAAQVAAVVRDPKRQDRYIATAQLGITGASLGLGMYAEHQMANWFQAHLARLDGPDWLASHGAASATAVLLVSYLHIVLGEMVPKAVALANPVSVAVRLVPVMRAIELVFLPVVVGLNLIGGAILRVMRVKRQVGASRYSPEELQDMVWESEESGLLAPQSASVVAELVDFGQLTAREVMIPRVKISGIESGSTLDDISRVVRAAPHTRYPVFAHDLDHIVGMIHIRDLVRRMSDGRPFRQSDVRAIPYVPGSATLDAVLDTMRKVKVQMAVVMDEHGGTDGIITTEDLFEEVVGDIQDEVSASPPDRRAEKDGALVAAGTVRVDEVGEHFDLTLEHEEVDTVSGLVLAQLDRPPVVGDHVRWNGLELEVLDIEGHGVSRARIRRTSEAPTEEAPAPDEPPAAES
ncbi:MAG TPA: hemolysin family protein [Kofleriaceae bacterium]|nr:hemolysin family protein [Kofleriaceae bacterium]